MEQLMYGSTHTHFEDLFDTGNDKKAMVLLFSSLGAKRVALTGHGSMFAYEDLKEIVANLKETKEIPEDFEIVPGVEVYFEDEAKHMVLVAKDYEGYQQLCRVITDSSRNTKTSRSSAEEQEYLTPIVTLENLQKNISEQGHVYMTTACAGGVFARSLGSDEISDYKRKVEKKRAAMEELAEKVDEAEAMVESWNLMTKDPSRRKLTKKETEKLAKAEEEGDAATVEALLLKQRRAEELAEYKAEHEKEVAEAKKVVANYEKREKAYLEANEELAAYRETFPQRFEEAKELYYRLESVFGKENVYFELQNHGLEQEEVSYNNITRLAYEVSNPRFIASNDVHIGDRKGSDTWEVSLKRRSVEMFNRFKDVKHSDDEEEYGVRTDEELRESLLQIITPVTDKDGVVHTPEEIVDGAIGNIKEALEPCHVVFPKISLDGINFYPKFCDDEAELFKAEVEKGIPERFPNGLPEGYRERIEYETSVIESMGFCGYHLIVKDYIEYGRLLGYLRTDEEIANAPLSIEGLNKYIDDNNIPRVGMGVGPGRGSAAGCLCAYLLGITDVDPIQYGLMFERFLNPSRHSMPDIDSDFKDDIRERLYQYIEARYGSECVSKVCTKAEAHGKAAAGIASRYLATLEGEGKSTAEQAEIKAAYGKSLKKVSYLITKYMDENDLSSVKVENGTKAAKALYAERAEAPEEGEDFAREQAILGLVGDIAGIPSNISMHACACLISGTPLSNVIPLAWNAAKQKMTTQCLYPQAEELGLLKMDLLNIKNLSVITRVMQECYKKGLEGDENCANDKLKTREGIQEMLNDPKIFEEIFCKGRTGGVFQFESDGMTKMVMDFQPRCFEDIIILVAAYRPGPIDLIPEMIQEKWYRELGDKSPMEKPKHKIDIDNEKLKEILEPTYGVPIYQEQIMKIVQELAGYNMADADNVRKYMSKKKTSLLEKERGFFVYGSEHVIKEATEQMNALRNKENPTEEDLKEANRLEAEIKKMPTYIKGCVPSGACTEKEANILFDAMMEFGKYAFNKSHAMCYAEVSMMTAYQKCYFPSLFYKYTLSNETKDGPSAKDKRMASEKYMGEIASFGMKILPPDPSKSSADWELEDDKSLRMGFGCIKGCHYEDYKPADNIFDFIWKNPDISISQVQVFVKLGMFDKIYDKGDNEVARCHGNRAEMDKWVQDYGEALKQAGKLRQECYRLNDIVKGIKAKEKDGTATEEEVQLRIDTEARIEDLKSVIKERMVCFTDDINTAMTLGEVTGVMQVQDRAYEYEKTGIVFSAEKDLAKLATVKGTKTLSFIEESRDKNDRYGRKATVAATVIGKTELPVSGKKPRWKITLMDKNGDTMQFSSFSKEDPVAGITCGMFQISYGTFLTIDKADGITEERQKVVTTNPEEFRDGVEIIKVRDPFNKDREISCQIENDRYKKALQNEMHAQENEDGTVNDENLVEEKDAI